MEMATCQVRPEPAIKTFVLLCSAKLMEQRRHLDAAVLLDQYAKVRFYSLQTNLLSVVFISWKCISPTGL